MLLFEFRYILGDDNKIPQIMVLEVTTTSLESSCIFQDGKYGNLYSNTKIAELIEVHLITNINKLKGDIKQAIDW